MGTQKRYPMLPYLIALTIFILNVLPQPTDGAKLPESEPKSEMAESSNKPKLISKRQTHGYGFHTNIPNPMQNSNSNSNYNRYESSRSNNLNYNSNPPSRDYQYYPSYQGQGSGSSGSSGSGRSGNYYDRDFRDNNRQPYYNDDYRYNNYQRDAMASPNNEVVVRHGQMRHEEYQKRTGSGGPEYYDPFYFLGVRKSQDPTGLSPSVSTLPAVRSTTAITGTSPVAPPRNRRNSHQRLNDFNNDINGAKYDIMTKSAYPLPSTSSHHHHHHHRLNNHHIANQNQFLTREQLVRQNPDSRVPYPSNHIDYYGSSPSGQPWSIRIGTQLKVNDDGRSPNPTRFYVRDENNPTRTRSRHPIYRR